MSPLAILVASIVVVLLITAATMRRIVRDHDRLVARREAVWARVEADLEGSRLGVRHGTRFTLDPANAPRGKATHVSSTGERSKNHG